MNGHDKWSLSTLSRQLKLHYFSDDSKNTKLVNESGLNECNNLSSPRWLKKPLLRALKKTKLRPKSIDLGCSGHYSSSSSAASFNLDEASEVIERLKQEMIEKDVIVKRLQQDAQDYLNQVKSLNQVIDSMREQINHLKDDNQKLKSLVQKSGINQGKY